MEISEHKKDSHVVEHLYLDAVKVECWKSIPAATFSQLDQRVQVVHEAFEQRLNSRPSCAILASKRTNGALWSPLAVCSKPTASK